MPAVGNLPVSASSSFLNDDLALIFGTCLPYAAFVMDPEEGVVVAANSKFTSFVQAELEDFASPGLKWESLIEPEDRGIFRTWERALTAGAHAQFEIRFQNTDPPLIPTQVSLTEIYWRQRRYLLGFLRETSEAERKEEEWKYQLEQQKLRAFEAIKSSLRLYQLNEKIRRTPQLARKLLHTGSEEELFEQAAQVLTWEEGLGYRGVTFFVLEGSVLRVVYSTQDDSTKTFSLTEENRFSKFVRKSLKPGGSSEQGILVPLESRGNLLGFYEVLPHTKEKVLFDEIGIVNEWQHDVLCDIGGIIALILDNLRLNRDIRRQSFIDPLTQTYNRHYFVSRLASEVERAVRYARPVSLLFLDLDSFKEINDEHGHLQGDEALRSVSDLFRKSLRELDVICRYGGDEFVILLPETPQPLAELVAEKLIRAVSEHRVANLDAPGEYLSLTVSMGLCTLKAGMNEKDILKAADAALYRAKTRGRNRLEIME